MFSTPCARLSVKVPSGRDGPDRPILAIEGSEPDVLFRLVSFVVPVVASPALGCADAGPAGSLVDGTGVSRGLDEHGGDVVALGPVCGQAAADDGEDVRAEVGDLDPGQASRPRRRPSTSGTAASISAQPPTTPSIPAGSRLTAIPCDTTCTAAPGSSGRCAISATRQAATASRASPSSANSPSSASTASACDTATSATGASPSAPVSSRPQTKPSSNREPHLWC